MHFEEAYKAMRKGSVVTITQSFSGHTAGFYRIKDLSLEYRRDQSDDWKPSTESLTTMMRLGYVLVED